MNIPFGQGAIVTQEYDQNFHFQRQKSFILNAICGCMPPESIKILPQMFTQSNAPLVETDRQQSFQKQIRLEHSDRKRKFLRSNVSKRKMSKGPS